MKTLRDFARRKRAIDEAISRGSVISIDDDHFVPYGSSLVSAGPYLPISWNFVQDYLRVSDLTLGVQDICTAGARTIRRDLSASKVHGDSMIGLDVYHGVTIIITRHQFEYVKTGPVEDVRELALRAKKKWR